jgi:hypothetical protein
MDRALYYQFVDVLVAGVIAAVVAFALVPVTAQATSIAVVLASMYYFSRNPWGSTQGERYNETIDRLYGRYLPGGER